MISKRMAPPNPKPKPEFVQSEKKIFRTKIELENSE